MTMSCTAWPSSKGEYSCTRGTLTENNIYLLSEDVYDWGTYDPKHMCVCEPLSPEGWSERAASARASVDHKHEAPSVRSCIDWSMISRCCWSNGLSLQISWWPYMVSVCMLNWSSLKRCFGRQFRDLNRPIGEAVSERRGRKEKRGRVQPPVFLCCCGWWSGEGDRGESI